MALSLQVSISEAITAQCSPPPSEPAKGAFLRLCRGLHKRKSWLFAGSERGAERAAAVTTLIATAKLNDVDPLAWLADVLARIADHKISDLAALLPWNWRSTVRVARAA